MNKKELTNQIKRLALHFGERVTCEWLSPDGYEWIEWKKAEINTQLLIDLEKGNIRNIQLSSKTVTIQAELITTFDTFQEWVNKASSRIGDYRHDEIVCVDQNGKILLSGKEFSFARDNSLFPVYAYRMIRNTDK